jgi:Inward rectifier potassium channel.
VHARSSYRAEELIWNARFSDMYVRDDEGHILSVDTDRFHNVERVEPLQITS